MNGKKKLQNLRENGAYIYCAFMYAYRHVQVSPSAEHAIEHKQASI